jgi:hypothetical protein
VSLIPIHYLTNELQENPEHRRLHIPSVRHSLFNLK